MNVVTCLDAGYALPFFALLRSLNRQPPSAKLRLYVVGAGLDARLVHRIRRCASTGISSLHFLEADARRVAHFPLQRWISRAAYLKLLAPGLLPEDAERAILLDSDLIVQSDLTPLWNADMMDRLLLAVQDFGCPYVSSSFGIKRYRELGLAADAPYFNSGVMLVDLERWRDEDVARRCFQYLESHAADLRCHDQEALNAVAANRWGQLDPRWNQMPHVYLAESLPESPYRERLLAHRQALVSAPHIIHFAGREKPWLPGCRHPARGLFIRELRSSGYFSLVGFLRWRWNLSRASWRRQMEVISPWESSGDEEASRNRRRYRWMDITRISAGRHHVWLHSARSGVARVLPFGTAHMLFACDSFRTLDTHARRLAGAALLTSLRMPAERRGGSRLARVARRQLARISVVGSTPLPLNREAVLRYRRQLEDFVRDGFLVADTELFAANASPNDSAEFGELSCVTVSALGIPTRDRPELLRRSLLSYADNLRRHDREAALLVIDDSRLLASVDLNAASAREVAKLSGLDITVVDRRWRAEYAQRLAAASGAPQDVVRFALLGDDRCPLSHGAARNTLQLLSIGSAVIHVDDDTVCRLGRVAERPDASAHQSDYRGMQYWYLDHGGVPESFEFVDADFLSLHEALLGASPRELRGMLEDGKLRAEIEELPPTSSSGSRRPADRAELPVGVGVTLGGAIGDSGMRNAWTWLFSDGPSFERLVADDGGYRQRLASRRVLRIALTPTVSASPQCIGMNLGLDNRRALPPFMPVQRNEDGVFMAVLRNCMPFVWTGHLAHAITHEPARHAQERLDFETIGRNFYVNDLLQWLLLSAASTVRSDDPARNLAATGMFLKDVSGLSPRGFEGHLRSAGARALNGQIGELERRIDERASPPQWALDAKRYVAALRFALSLPDFIVPSDLGGAEEGRLSIFRSLVELYGDLLSCWPEILNAAARQEGPPRSCVVVPEGD